MKRERYDVVVVGSGIAGLFYALKCAEFCKVLVVTKGSIGESNTMYAQGGIAAVINPADSIESHIADTLVAGDGLCDERVVRLIAENAGDVIQELLHLHVQFNLSEQGDFDLHREGGHSAARILHHDDATGREVENRLVTAVRTHSGITILENHFATDLIMRNGVCLGVKTLLPDLNKVKDYYATVTMLATGGAGQVYSYNTNPAIATGDGFAMAYRAGAVLMDMEFVQFHPTTLYSAKGGDTFLITEAIRGFGAELKNSAGESFMDKYHPMKSLAPRDIVTRAIINEMRQSGADCVYLDLRGFSETKVREHFPNIYNRCLAEGLDITKDMIPVTPAAHYMCGGIKTDTSGRTSIKNLYACGECTGTGVHGANRLASNSLLEGLVFAKEAAQNTLLEIKSQPPQIAVEPSLSSSPNVATSAGSDYREMKGYVQNLMWNNAGIIRFRNGLQYCLSELSEVKGYIEQDVRQYGISKESMELVNMIDCSMMIADAALQREESRGCHFRSDYPKKQQTAQHTLYIANKGCENPLISV
jgi:L-aspartate oxidase